MRLNINKDSVVRIQKNGREVVGKVIRVLNQPLKNGETNDWFFWDLEYTIPSTGNYGRWKQNVDGGTVTLVEG